MEIIWAETAKVSYTEELDFIYRKWGGKQVENFIALSEEFFKILK